jgi:catechol 2,3-dioxygenase-like lactoylglutathione lyase family enzyme
VVRDTAPSLAFFQDALGLKVRGTSENYGPEQEHLNNVFGARLLITSLGAPAGPAVEFLDYLAPATGRPTPLDTQANDLWSWQIRMETPDLDALEQTLRHSGAAFVSPGIVDMPDDALALGRALMVRGPAGHALLLVERSQ